ncbi:hypothetical protein EV383_2975 [Pseudonocardia sediminis]|uniref:Uncharacterized protein n=1 Tax=Pseudonocardia sediminis TaxID=1397368 RepID=A0A4Q7UVS6_PSEST|nr:hypothetical protein EV383_2975 [Pseudonocardia sediminis]
MNCDTGDERISPVRILKAELGGDVPASPATPGSAPPDTAAGPTPADRAGPGGDATGPLHHPPHGHLSGITLPGADGRG